MSKNLNLNYSYILNDLWYKPETLWILPTFTRDYFAGKKIQKNIKVSGGNIFLYRAHCQKKEFGYVGTVLVAELNICMYNKLLVFYHLIFSKDYVAYFADQLL